MRHDVGIRNLAIVGPYASGKTSLLEALLFAAGAIDRRGRTQDGNTVGDSSPEARDRHMSVELSVASCEHDGLRLNLLDCPGSVEFQQETLNALMGVDAALVCCEADPERVLTLAPLLRFLDRQRLPHLLFINKIDRTDLGQFSAAIEALKTVSERPLVLHQFPIHDDREPIGYVDLIDEQAHHFTDDREIPLPAALKPAETAARQALLEVLADHDDQLLELLLEDRPPSPALIAADLQRDLSRDDLVPVLLGSAERGWGIPALLGCLSRELPEPVIPETPDCRVQVLKTFQQPQAGKLSLVRIRSGELVEGQSLNGDRSGGLYRLMGHQTQPLTRAIAGDIVAVSRLESARTGDSLSDGASAEPLPRAPQLQPVYALAIAPERRQDEVKLSQALKRLQEEDPALQWTQHGDTHEVVLWGQGEIHLRVALERLRRKFGLPMTTQTPTVPYRETIRRSCRNVHGRYKHQTGGHGQFGDVYLDIQPLTRGEGFRFAETIVGGVVPRQYIPGVEAGVRDQLAQGPLGYPVVDVAVTLTSGSYHSVDSSEQAFRQAARQAMQEALTTAEPMLLEPVLAITLSVPTPFTAAALKLVNGRRGQVLGYDRKPDWEDWDEIVAQLPQAELTPLPVDPRSATQGAGCFTWEPYHLEEVPDRRPQPQAVASRGRRH